MLGVPPEVENLGDPVRAQRAQTRRTSSPPYYPRVDSKYRKCSQKYRCRCHVYHGSGQKFRGSCQKVPGELVRAERCRLGVDDPATHLAFSSPTRGGWKCSLGQPSECEHVRVFFVTPSFFFLSFFYLVVNPQVWRCSIGYLSVLRRFTGKT